jgi:serine/threonine protein kinase
MKARRIGDYEVLGLLGEGGIGQVYVARDVKVGRQAAIKTLRPEFARDKQFIERFYAEAQNMGRLAHQNIATLYGLHDDRREPAMAMELVRGHTLTALLNRVRRLSVRDTLAFTIQTIAGLSYAHREGLIHRDIKPDNLMVTERGLVKIMDFGISRVQGTKRLTRAGQMFGTLLYAPPEQIRGGDVDERSDLYSLAVVVYEMPPPPLAGRARDLPPHVEAAIMRALAKRPEDRFATVDEFGRALGVASVASESADILQQLVASSFRNMPSAATRMISTPPGTAPQGDGRPNLGFTDRGGRDKASDASRPGWTLPGLSAIPQGFRAPVMLLGAAVIGLAIGLGYMFSSSTPPPPTPIVVKQDTNPPPLPQPAPEKQVAVTPKPPPSPSTVMVPSSPTPPPTPTPSPPGEKSVTNPFAVLPPPPNPTPPQNPAPTPTPPPSSPVVYEPPGRGTPSFTGMFQDLDDYSVYIFAGKRYQLLGINDPKPGTPQHKAEVLATVRSILSGKRLDCYLKTSVQMQCYINGEEDFARLLLDRGLVIRRGDTYASQ